MPALYRSKSVRRFNEANCRITNLIEKNNQKVIAAASIQLFISTPHLEKWFKSSTGTICFLKDFTHKHVYYFRLYSLMQGQLWEQEMHAPFSYKKLSSLFHYLTVIRFNFGFKFICEDEAERFYSAVTKFSAGFQQNAVRNRSFNSKTVAQSALLNSTTISNGHSIASASYFPNEPIGQTIKNRRYGSGKTIGSIAKASFIKSMIDRSPSSSTHSLNTDSIILTKNSPKFSTLWCSKTEDNNRRSRRMFYSTDRKKIEKSDISCPFRCSRDDLNTTTSDQNSSNSLKAPNTLEPKNSSVQRTRSAASFSKISMKLNEQQEIFDCKKLNVSRISTTNSSSSLASNRSMNSQTKRGPSKISNSTLKQNESLADKSNKCMNKYSSINSQEAQELDVTKQILIEYNVPIDKKVFNDLRNYITEYGDIDRFQDALKSESERNKLNLFIAQASASLICKNKSLKQAIPNNYVDNSKTPPLDRSKYQTLMPPLNPNQSNQSNLSISPSTPRKLNTKQSINTPNNSTIPNLTPFTPSITTNSTKNQSSRNTNYSLYQVYTPVSIQKNSNSSCIGQPPIVPQSDVTPVRIPSHLTNLNYRNQTPSPLRNHQFRSNVTSKTSPPSSIDGNAPPKPPRRTSLKIIN